MARPRKHIDWKNFDKLCRIQCTLEEIASFFDMCEDTIEAIVKRDKKMSFSDYYKKKSAGGKSSLRRAQFKLALSGHATMLIWLGKQYLGQIDKDEISFDQVKPFTLAYDPNKVTNGNDK